MNEFDLNNKNLVNDIKKALTLGKYEFTSDGMMLFDGDINFKIGGIFDCWIDRNEAVEKAREAKDYEKELFLRNTIGSSGPRVQLMRSQEHNLIPDAGINYILNVLFYSTSKISTWYHGPFKSDWTPVAGALSNWAGATSGPLATELTNAEYDETNRQAAIFGNAASAKTIASSTATTFTLASGVSGLTLYGSTLNSIATVAYNATDEVLVAATRFASAKSGLAATDVVNISYSITGASA